MLESPLKKQVQGQNYTHNTHGLTRIAVWQIMLLHFSIALYSSLNMYRKGFSSILVLPIQRQLLACKNPDSKVNFYFNTLFSFNKRRILLWWVRYTQALLSEKVGSEGLQLPQISHVFLQMIALEKHFQTAVSEKKLPCWIFAVKHSSSMRGITSALFNHITCCMLVHPGTSSCLQGLLPSEEGRNHPHQASQQHEPQH